ncbi:MAG: GH92 family glycosyl hydrolase [Mariniphaga sp.]
MLKFYVVCLSVLFSIGCHAKPTQLTRYVNPFIGTIFEGNVYPGATLPFGMVQLSPDNGLTKVEKYEGYCSGYSYTKNMVKGFSHTHLSGTGRPDLGDISILPMVGLEPNVSDIRSEISHQEESASPGYYRVMLKTFGIKAELTATQRCGFHRYTFPDNSKSMIRIDMAYGAGDDATVDSEFKQIDATTFVGYRISKSSFTKDQRIYFAARISKPIAKMILYRDSLIVNGGKEAKGKDIKACLLFTTAKNEQVMVKVGLSTANVEGAMAGLKETGEWDFNAVKKKAEGIWEKELEKINITSKDENFKTVFYTALYHSYLAPILIDDALGKYRGIDKQTIRDGRNIYTIHSLWDTYRAANPLLTLTQEKRVPDIINSYLSFYRQYGLLPVWDLYFSETNTMKGYHAVPVVADAILKGFKGFDYREAYTAMKASANQNIRGTDWYRKLGYIPMDKDDGSVTSTLEYAFDDWCIAHVAKLLGEGSDYQTFMKRSESWKNMFDSSVTFVRPKDENGNWVNPFNPLNESIGKIRAFAEGNAWQYTFYVPHDVYGLIGKFGSKELFSQKLDSLFTLSPPKDQPIWQYDGYIGLVWHGNEPCHHIPYLYNYVGQPWKTAEKVRQICAFYLNKPRGLCGNDDCGQTSAWYIYSAIGFYPVNPANGEYVIGTPLADKSELTLLNGKHFIVKAESLSDKNIYIQKATLKGKPYTKTYIKHADIVNGGTLVIYMGPKPSPTWGTKDEDFPH